MVLVKAWFIGVIISIALIYAFDKITTYLDGKPKEHKFRKWWSKYICDLDNLYN
jgi:hypothetical protein